ncbi:MAG: hypothetical protein ABIQ39_02030, partial [Ilumatobacteraceae bacterium]
MTYVGPPATADGRTSTVWLLDRAIGATTELTVPADGVRPGNSVHPVISADGCHVVVVTEIPFDLFRDDDTGTRWDVYQLTLPACGGQLGVWELVSTVSGDNAVAAAGDDVSPNYAPAVSGTAAIVSYVRNVGVAGSGLTAVQVIDRTVALGDAGRSVAVAGTPPGPPPDSYRYTGQRQPSVSDDGDFISFTSDALSASPTREWSTGSTPGGFATSQVFVWDRSNPDPASNVAAVSSPAAAPANGEGGAAAISADGRYVAFESTATNLVPGAVLPACTTTCVPQIYRLDRTTGTILLASRQQATIGATPVATDSGAYQPAISADGGDVAFVSRASNLFDVRSLSATGDPGEVSGDVVVIHLASGAVERVSVLADGVTPAPAAQSAPQISADGRTVVFNTAAGGAYQASLTSG